MATTIHSNLIAQQNLTTPAWDMILLGAGSIVIITIIRLLSPASSGIASSVAATLMLANVINHPHFAQSYFIFYRDFIKKCKEYSSPLREAYLFSGIIVPILLIALIALLARNYDATYLGLMANLMFLSVGWHYVKQGYGMAIVDAVLKKRFYNESEKKVLLRNSYIIWLIAWMWQNQVTPAGSKYWGVPFSTFHFPKWVLLGASFLGVISTLAVLRMLVAKFRTGSAIANAGVLAYFVSLYAWLLVFDPIVLLWVPLFHSLQYLTVVTRFEINRRKATSDQRTRWIFKYILWVILSVSLGYVMFWQLPTFLDSSVAYKFGEGVSFYMFSFWIFINIHHYFLDTVMWRKGNPEVSKYLFS